MSGVEAIEVGQEPTPPSGDRSVSKDIWRRRIYAVLFVVITLTILFAPLLQTDVERYDIMGLMVTNHGSSTQCQVEIRDNGVGGVYNVTFYVQNETATSDAFIDPNDVGTVDAYVHGVGSFFCHVEVDAPKVKEGTSLARVLYDRLMGE